ncbi:MAG TPA: BON domain-containing protein [Pyrinomonadaceae bacterium]|jgi:hyperosmotically inducible protein
MRSKTLLTLLAGATLSLSAAACNSADNANANANSNAGRAANSNAVVTNTNANANANATANANSRNYNMTRDEYKKDETNYRSEAKGKGESIGQGLEDGWIHLKVRGALATIDDLRDSTINVDVDNNVVTLRGSVANAASKKAAEDAAKKIDGVKSVTNKLEVKPDGSSNSNKSGNANSGAANSNKK